MQGLAPPFPDTGVWERILAAALLLLPAGDAISLSTLTWEG